MNKEISTTELLAALDKLSEKEDINDFIKNLDTPIPKESFFNNYIATHNISVKDVANRCIGYVSKSYIYELLNGVKTNPSRNILLLICIAFHMTAKETRRALAIYNLPALYPKFPRDAVILTCINNGTFDFEYINDTLASYNLELLTQ